MQEINTAQNIQLGQLPQPPKRNWWKTAFFLLLFVIIIIIGLTRSNFFMANTNQITPTAIPTPQIQATPTTSVEETINWKTYINNKYQYSLKYAVNANLKQFTCSSTQSGIKGEDTFVLEEIESTFPECGFGGYLWPVSIYVEDQPVSTSCNSEENYTVQQSSIIVAGKEATKCSRQYTGQKDGVLYTPYTESVSISHGGKHFNFSLANQKYKETFDQILSTFKFTD